MAVGQPRLVVVRGSTSGKRDGDQRRHTGEYMALVAIEGRMDPAQGMSLMLRSLPRLFLGTHQGSGMT